MFYCNYCMVEHEDSFASKEHIVSEKLLNSSHTLPNVCNTTNRFLALSFEQDFNTDPFVRDVLFYFSPPNKKNKQQYHGTVTTKRGTTEHRYSENGKEFLADQPEYKGENVIPLKTKSKSGEEVTFLLEFPFEIVTHAQGSSKLLKMDRILKKNENAIQDYLDDLWKDPSINPEFAKFVVEHEISLDKSPKIEPRVEESTSGGGVVSDVEDKLIPINFEIYSKTFLKMGWSHCCKILGREVLDNPVGDWVLKYLTSSIIPADLSGLPDFAHILSSGLFSEYDWFGSQKLYWKNDLNMSLSMLNDCKEICIESKEVLFRLLKIRTDRIKCAGKFFSLENEPCLRPEFDFSNKENRKHRFHLENHTVGEKSGLCCGIHLFGGIFKGSTQLTNCTVEIPKGAEYFEIAF